MPRPQTIQIFLPTGSPTGVKEAEMTSRLIKTLYFPRTAYEEAAKRELSNYTGVYFLFGIDDNGNDIVYIGEGENCWERIKDHQRRKEFWTECIIAGTKTNDYNKTDAKYLEHHCLKIAMEIGRYEFDNDKASSLPSISESREADLLDHFETLKILIGSLGFPLFESVKGIKQESEELEKYTCSVRNIKAEGFYTNEGFLVLKGSKAKLNESATAGSWIINMRQRLKDKGVLVDKESHLEFVKDELFKSPSAASGSVLARRSNGWIEWKNKEGKSLDELRRNQ